MEERDVFIVATRVLLHNKGKFLILKRSDYKPHVAGQYDTPGGGLHKGETPKECIIRETLEEVGIAIKDPVLYYSKITNEGAVMLEFFANVNSKEVKLSHEHREFLWVSLGELEDEPEWFTHGIKLVKELGLV